VSGFTELHQVYLKFRQNPPRRSRVGLCRQITWPPHYVLCLLFNNQSDAL